jgi:hypothetical protein
VDHQLCDCDIFLTEIRSHLLHVPALMKLKHDKQHRELELAVGDWDWLGLNHRIAVSGQNAGPSKLAPKFFGPYKVIEHIGSVAYRMQLLTRARIHNVFHVAFLRKFEGVAPERYRCCRPLCAVAWCPSLTKCFTLAQLKLHGSCWLTGKIARATGQRRPRRKGSSNEAFP